MNYYNSEMEFLLHKFIRNECNSEESDKVVAYFRKAKDSNDIPSVEDIVHLMENAPSMKEESADRIFNDIISMEKKREVGKVRRSSLLLGRYVAVASMLIGFICMAYFFREWGLGNYNDLSSRSLPPKQDQITLTLQNGDVKSISEDGSFTLTDKDGNIIGKQHGDLLEYNYSAETGEASYNMLSVPLGRRFKLTLSDGTVVHLNSGTRLKYPIAFLKGRERKVYLTGEAFFEVARDEVHPFLIDSDGLNVRVLGTQFNISSYPEDAKTDVVLVEGSVALFRKGDDLDRNTTILDPGQKGSFVKDRGAIETMKVNTNIYTSWINGELVFRKMTFEDMLKRLERHYDVVITNQNLKMAKELFNASFDNVPIGKVLEYLKITYQIDYHIDGKEIIIN